MGRKQQRFTEEFEAEAVRLVETSGRTQREIAEDLGIGLSTLLRWTGAAMMEAAKGFRRLNACRQLPALRAALKAHQMKHALNSNVEDQTLAA